MGATRRRDRLQRAIVAEHERPVATPDKTRNITPFGDRASGRCHSCRAQISTR